MRKMKKITIRHYEEKIAWAKTRPSDEHPSKGHMFYAIGHSWQGTYCPYCQKYNNRMSCIQEESRCPLLGKDEINCCNGLWRSMNKSTTWAEWITNAEKVLGYIKEHG